MERKKIFSVIVFITIAALLATLIYALREPLTPVFLALFFAYLFDPVVDKMVSWKINRVAAIFILAVGLVIVVGLVGTFLVFKLQRELVSLYQSFPEYLEKIQSTLVPLAQEYLGIEIPTTIDEIMNELSVQVKQADLAALKPVSAVIGKATHSTLSTLGWALGFLIIPVFLFYFLRDWDRMKADAIEYVPFKHRDYVREKAFQVDDALGGFLRGQLTVVAVLAVLYSIGLVIVGIDFAVLIGVSSGILFIVPYLGTMVGIVAGTVMALLEFGLGWQVLGVWGVFAVIQLFEGNLMTPHIMGEKVGLSPVIVILSLLIGADLLGLLGMILAVPFAAVLKVFVREGIESYRNSNLYMAGASKTEKET